MNYKKVRECRFCSGKLKKVLNLGKLPAVNYYPEISEKVPVKKYPLELAVCSKCELLQLSTIVDPEVLFKNYHYQSSASAGLIENLKELATFAGKKYQLKSGSKVLDIGSNDGSFLKNFLSKEIFVLGIDPGKEVDLIAKKNGVQTLNKFFNSKTAKQIRQKFGQFDLITSLHNLANIPDINDFLSGIQKLLRENGKLIIEVADSGKMLKEGRFDSIYHEHYNYWTLETLRRILKANGFCIDEVLRNNKQGGSIRIFASLDEKNNRKFINPKINIKKYELFAEQYLRKLDKIKSLMKSLKGKKVAGFGAPAKAVVLLNICKASVSQINFVIDSTPFKQGKKIPGTNIPIFPEDYLQNQVPEYCWLFAWNYKKEILEKLKNYKGIKIIIPFPELKIIES